MATEKEDKSWIEELESALNEDCIRQDDHDEYFEGKILTPALRPEVWKSCLYVRDPESYFDDIFDLREQDLIRNDCQNFVAQLGNDEEDKVSVLSDLESILTSHRKSISIEYEQNNGWIALLKPLINLKLPRAETYAIFQSIYLKYCPKHPALYHLFRLLILYHDPQLCSFIDTKRITPESYTAYWFQSLFASMCSIPAVSAIWDLHFQQGDPFFILFLGLVLLLNARNEIVKRTEDSKEDLMNLLKNLPSTLHEEDIPDLCALAQYYCDRTPQSFRQEVEGFMFESAEGMVGWGGLPLEQALCLPVSVRELLDSVTSPPVLEANVRFFLVDCRPPDQYNAGHLPTAFHLDPNLMLLGGQAFNTAVQGLVSSKTQALEANSKAGGEHLCFMGCGGSLLDDQFTHMIIASFLHSNTAMVTLLTGGYAALHEYFNDIDSILVDHNSAACLVCLKERTEENRTPPVMSNSPSKDLLGKIGDLRAAVKLKSAEVKEKLLEYIVNTGGSEIDRHISSRDNARKRYRNIQPVFSIDDDHDTFDNDYENHSPELDSFYEVVSLSAWLKKPEMVGKFSCEEVKMNGETFKSYLLVSETHMYVLRCGSRDNAKVVTRRPLVSIAKITGRKRNPTIITFKYCTPYGDSTVISDMDRFIIPKAKEVTSVIASLIEKLLEKPTTPQEE